MDAPTLPQSSKTDMSPPRALRLWLVVTVCAVAAARANVARSQAPTQADAATGPLTRFEMQRALVDLDEQRRRFELQLEPVDSLLRALAADTMRIAALKRSPAVDQDVATVTSTYNQLAQLPGAPDLSRHLIDAVTVTARDFSMPDGTLSARVLLAPAAGDALARNPNAGVVSVNDDLPPYDTPLWGKIRASDYGERRLAHPTAADIAGFRAAVSDSGFAAYKQTLAAAFAKRIGDVRQARDAARLDVARIRRRAADLARTIGEQDAAVQSADARVVDIGLPIFGLLLVILLLMPRMYRSEEMQRWMFTSGLVMEMTTVVLLTAAILILAMANRIHAEVVGALLGGLSGYTLGRSLSRRTDVAPPVAPQVKPAPVSSIRLR